MVYCLCWDVYFYKEKTLELCSLEFYTKICVRVYFRKCFFFFSDTF